MGQRKDSAPRFNSRGARARWSAATASALALSVQGEGMLGQPCRKPPDCSGIDGAAGCLNLDGGGPLAEWSVGR